MRGLFVLILLFLMGLVLIFLGCAALGLTLQTTGNVLAVYAIFVVLAAIAAFFFGLLSLPEG